MESLINRVKNILVTPKTEWQVIDSENSLHAKVFTSYVIPLALIPAIAAFIGYGLIGVHGLHLFGWGIRWAITQFILMAGGVYVTALVINLLAEGFGGKKNFDKAFSLVAYAYTPAFIGGIFYILPSLSSLSWIASLYSLYLLYIGLQPLMKQPEDKTTTYFIVSLLVFVVAFGVLSAILTAIIVGSLAAAVL
jgi:hypothetical protein